MPLSDERLPEADMGAVDASLSHSGSRVGTRCFSADFSGRAEGDGGTAVPPPMLSTALMAEDAVPAAARPFIPCALPLNVNARLRAPKAEEAAGEAEFGFGTGDAEGRGDDDRESDRGDECATN